MGGTQSSYEVSPKKGMDANDSYKEDPPLGMESCAIPSSRITASSSNNSAPAHLGRLHGARAWCAGSPADCFLEVDLQTVHHVTALATQGNPTGNKDYVMKYKLQYSKDGENWRYYMQDYREVLEGNRDHSSVVKRYLSPSIAARYVRVWPTAWFQWPGLRLEIYGRPAPFIDKENKGETSNVLETKAVEESPREEGGITLEIQPQESKTVVEAEREHERLNEVDVTSEETEVVKSEAEQEDEYLIEIAITSEEIEAVKGEEDTRREFEIMEKKRDAVNHKNNNLKITSFEETLESPVSDIETNDRHTYDAQLSLDSTASQPRSPVTVAEDFRRLLEVKKRLEFEAELRSLKEEQKVELRRKKKKKVRLGCDTPDMFTVPRRVYAEMWGESPSESIESGLDTSATEDLMIERGYVGAPLAKLDDDSIDVEPARSIITIRTTVRTVSPRTTSPGMQNGTMDEDTSIQPTSAAEGQSQPDYRFFLLNGFSDTPTPFGARASCDHLHATDPAVQTAMESSFHERLDSFDDGGSPLDNKRFSGLDLLQMPYNAVSGEDLERLLAWEDQLVSGWSRVKKSRDLEIYKGKAIDGGPPIIKATMTLKDISYNEARRRITNLDVRKQWDKTFDEISILERTYNFNVIRCSIKKQVLTLAILEEIDPDEPYHACVWSVADCPDNQPTSPTKMLRYETMISGLVIRPIEDGTQSSKVTLLCQVKGSVAAPLRNTYLTGNPEKWIEMLKKYNPKPTKTKVVVL